ncbi:MAG: acetyl-CoA carboxylase carboxyl transferase subunit alpha/beta [Deltaproteobacteria bacterium RIFOXYD12_FULL_57_12]|nr:MAG: acetyl-CoA carboxylase carboxyl transferase subunit alpha/beta [Deltaproteobacteria bacterium RIFOXYD12_FULL_57_12]
MDDLRKRLLKTEERLIYLAHVKDSTDWGNLTGFQENLKLLQHSFYDYTEEQLAAELRKLEEGISFIEKRGEESLSAMERVRIVRNPLRFTLKDILENVYEDYTELGGEEDASIDPSIVTAKANIVRRVKNKVIPQTVMVIGQEKGHGEEFRNGGSCKPWGNEKALRYMRVAETEGIPIHFYIFTPGSFPVEDYPGAAQQIARNLYAMCKLRVPMISVISEGGSGGAEAIGLTDFRLMFSHGYYSVISPEGAAAIEGKIREGEKVPKELVEACADRLCITARENLAQGTIDRIIQEPPLGARRDDFAFFRQLRSEVIRATDEVILKTKSLRSFRAYEVKLKKAEAAATEEPQINISWDLHEDEVNRLLIFRSRKYRNMTVDAFVGQPSPSLAMYRKARNITARIYYSFRYDLLRNQQKQMEKVIKDVSGEGSVILNRIAAPLRKACDFINLQPLEKTGRPAGERPPLGSEDPFELWDTYTSPLANEDRTVTCPNTAQRGCKDLWVPDLYGEFAGVCENCGHHFPLEYEWYLKHLFDPDSIREFNAEYQSINPLAYPGFDDRLNVARAKTGRNSANLTFYGRVMDTELVVTMLYSDFRNGTVGAVEGEKFVRACEKARLKRRPLLAYVHTTGGIRIQEGTIGVVQMPKCTMAVREYIDSGGLYIVVYDNNSYAGPVASFLGCSPYQFAIRSSRIGFAGYRVIRETTGDDIPPDYHSARNALKRGHIQGIWDRREFRKNLHRALLTMGGRNLYYR